MNCFAVGPARGGAIVDAEDYYREVADAIESAKNYVLVSGWQLEGTVQMRRRPDDEGKPRTLLEIVEGAVRKNPRLHVWILAWDWAAIFLLDREWGTDKKFIAIDPERVHFRYDAAHAPLASHHEKFVLIDGHTAYTGGIDLCEHRWDNRLHAAHQHERTDGKGEHYGPYHDIAVVVRGEPVKGVADSFVARWVDSGSAEKPVLVDAPASRGAPKCHVSFGKADVAFSRTRGATMVPPRERIDELEQLLVQQLRRASKLVYIEQQYITSRSMGSALMERMRDRQLGKLEVVVILPRELEGSSEKVSIEGPQQVLLSALARLAGEMGHAFGTYSPCVPKDCADEKPGKARCHTYVHSKMLIVDDRFVTIGSANATNRSMGLDTELNASWCSSRPRDAVERGIRQLRVSLLSEHTGLTAEQAVEKLARVDGLVDRLAEVAADPKSRLMPFELDEDPQSDPMTEWIASVGDPERAAIVEDVLEQRRGSPGGAVAKLIDVARGLVAR